MNTSKRKQPPPCAGPLAQTLRRSYVQDMIARLSISTRDVLVKDPPEPHRWIKSQAANAFHPPTAICNWTLASGHYQAFFDHLHSKYDITAPSFSVLKRSKTSNNVPGASSRACDLSSSLDASPKSLPPSPAPLYPDRAPVSPLSPSVVERFSKASNVSNYLLSHSCVMPTSCFEPPFASVANHSTAISSSMLQQQQAAIDLVNTASVLSKIPGADLALLYREFLEVADTAPETIPIPRHFGKV